MNEPEEDMPTELDIASFDRSIHQFLPMPVSTEPEAISSTGTPGAERPIESR
jgi:hypothetical protein